MRTELFVAGRWRPASDGATMTVTDPATDEILAEVSSASVADALDAVESAHRIQRDWAARAPRDRSEVLRRAYDLMIAKRRTIAELIVRENGKCLRDADNEVAYAAEFFRWYSEEAVRNRGEIMQAPAGNARIVVLSQPIGVAVLITPWNFPAAMATRKIAPALAAGCGVVLKPAANTPLTALLIAELLHEAGVPGGLVNVIPGRNSAEVVNAMLADERVRKLSFTGSTEVGRVLLAQASKRIIDCSMELGGNAPFIVMADADVDAAVDGAMTAKMRNGGEACTAANRFFVHTHVVDEFITKFSERMKSLKIGHGLDPDVDLGPLISKSARGAVHGLVDQAATSGATLVTGGRIPAGAGAFYPPTVLADVAADAAILRTEIFGPIAPIVTFTATDKMIELANATEYGLASYLYVGDLGAGMNIAEQLESGMVGLNRGLVSDPAAPFGGTKQSGIGREGAQDGMQEFLEKKYIATNW